MLKYNITLLLWQPTETFNLLLYLSRTNGNYETCIPIWFEQLKESTQSWGIFTG